MTNTTGAVDDAPKPTDVQGDVSLFDRFATAVDRWVSKAWFFLGCVLIVVIWAPTITFMDVNTWQLVINTLTTIITFLLVALLQNTQSRSNDAIQKKLNAIADGLADLMLNTGDSNSRLNQDRRELLAAAGLEDRESSG